MNRRELVKSLSLVGAFHFFGIGKLYSINNTLDYRDKNKEKMVKNSGDVFKFDLTNPLSQNYFFIDFDAKNYNIYADEFTFSSELDFIYEQENLNIYCNKLIFKKSLKLSGKNLNIFSNKIEFDSQEEILISTAGNPGVNITDRQIQKPEDNKPGANGTDADNKDANGNPYKINGDNGGSVNLVLMSKEKDTIANNTKVRFALSGGNGSKGESGSNGVIGGKGDNGEDCKCRVSKEQPGRQGKKGGNSGIGAPGGVGGNGGKFLLFGGTDSLAPAILEKKYNIKIDYLGGRSGESGESGNPGGGGSGGEGGKECYTSISDKERSSSIICHTGVDRDPAKIGPIGEPGNIRKAPYYFIPKTGKNGSLEVADIDDNRLKNNRFNLLPLIELLIFKGEVKFLNRDFNEALSTLSFAYSCIQFHKKNNGIEKEILSKENRVLAHLHNLNIGNNFWGKPANFVTIISYELINEKLQKQLNYVTAIEKAYRDSFLMLSRKDDEIKTRKGKIAELEEYSKKLLDKNKEIALETQGLIDLNSTLINEYNSYTHKLEKAEENFKAAVSANQGGCSFDKIIKLAGTVVSIARVIGGDVSAIQGAVGNISNQIDTSIDRLNQNSQDKDDISRSLGLLIGSKKGDNIISSFTNISDAVSNNIDKITNNTTEIIDRTSKIRKELSDFADKNLKNDSDKLPKDMLALSQADFDSVMQPYLEAGMQQAVEYNQLVKNFIALTQNMNQNRLKIFSNVIEIGKNNSEILNYKKAINDNAWQNNIDANQLPVELKMQMVNSYYKFMYGLYYQTDLLYQALNFLTLNKEELKIETTFTNSVVLNNYKNLFDTNLIALKNLNLQSPPSDLTTKKIIFKRYFDSEKENQDKVFESFVSGVDNKHNFIFSFSHFNDKDINAFGGSERYKHRVTEIESIKIFGIKSDEEEINVKLFHLGDSKIKKNEKEIFEFQHKSLDYGFLLKNNGNYFSKENFNLNSDSGNSDTSITKYSNISPFATWQLQIKVGEKDNPGLDVSQIEKIEIKFKYYSYGKS